MAGTGDRTVVLRGGLPGSREIRPRTNPSVEPGREMQLILRRANVSRKGGYSHDVQYLDKRRYLPNKS
jgi:hypothetical protein